MAAVVDRSVPGKAQLIVRPGRIYVLDHVRPLRCGIEFPSEQFHIKIFRSDVTTYGRVVFACHGDLYRITSVGIPYELIGYAQGYFGCQTLHIYGHGIGNGVDIRHRFKREIILFDFLPQR